MAKICSIADDFDADVMSMKIKRKKNRLIKKE